jgi:hypothetical protein
MLSELIAQHAQSEFDAGDDAGVVAILNTPSIEQRDDDLYTWAGIALLAGPQAAEMLRVALEANGMGWAVHQFGGTGLQMTNPLVRQAVEQFIAAGIPLQPLLDATMWLVSPAQASMGRDVTVEDIAAYRQQLAVLARLEMLDGFQARFDAIKNQIGTSEQPQAVAALRAIAEELEA